MTKKVTQVADVATMLGLKPSVEATDARDGVISEARARNWSKHVTLEAGAAEVQTLITQKGWKDRPDLVTASQVNKHGEFSTAAVAEDPGSNARVFLYRTGSLSVQNLTREQYAQLLA